MALDYNQLNHAVLGSGPMGLLLSSLLCKKIDEVYLWIPDAKLASELEKSRYAKFLQTPFTLPDNLRVVSNFSEFDRNSWAFHIAVPSRILEETVNNLIDVLIKDQEYLFVLFTKGLLPHKTRRQTGLYLFSSYITTKLQEKAIVNSQVSVVNGPSLLQEIYENQNTFLNIGCKDTKGGEFVAELYRNMNIHTMTTLEVESMEFAGVMKNPIAIAIGIVSALPDCGSNIQGELIQLGFNEMLKFAKTLHLSEEIFLGRSGLSDLITTSVSNKSRNRNYGRKIVGELMVGPTELSIMDRFEIWFKPKSFIEKEVGRWIDTVEGAYALGIILELANENGIKLPLYEVLFSVLARKSPPQAIASLLTDKKSEFPLEKMVGLKKIGMDLAAGNNFQTVLEERILKHILTSAGFISRIKKQTPAILQKLEKKIIELKLNKSIDEITNTEKEIDIWNQLLVSSKENEISNIRNVIAFYVHEIADRYNPAIRESLIKMVAPIRFFSGGFRFGSVTPHLGGEIDQIKKLAGKYNFLYTPTHQSHLDSIELAYGFNKLELPIPRYAAGINLMTSPFWEWILKSLGAYAVDRDRTRNSLYLECLTIYSTLILESGIPSLVYPEGTRSRTGGIVPIKTGILKTAIEAFQNTGSEIIIVPVALSYETIPEDEQFCGIDEKLGAQDFLNRRTNVYMDFCEPIPISEHMGSEDPTLSIGYDIQKGWSAYHRILPNQILCKLLSENDLTLHIDSLPPLIDDFILNFPGNYLTRDSKQIIHQGLKSIQKRKIVRVENGKLIVLRPDLLSYYGCMVPCNAKINF